MNKNKKNKKIKESLNGELGFNLFTIKNYETKKEKNRKELVKKNNIDINRPIKEIEKEMEYINEKNLNIYNLNNEEKIHIINKKISDINSNNTKRIEELKTEEIERITELIQLKEKYKDKLKKENKNKRGAFPKGSTREEIETNLKGKYAIQEKNIIFGIIFLTTVIVVSIIVLQLKTINFTDIKSLEAMRDGELKAEITNLNSKNKELEEKIKDLDKNISVYNQSVREKVNAPKLIQDELKQTERYLGYTNAEGEGLSITLSDNDNKSIDYNDLLMLVNQLWIAGAEAVSVNDERIVSTTEIVPVEGKNIFINTKKQSSPYVIKAIGNKKHLESALTVKNGFINEMLANGKSIKYKVEDKIEIPKYKSEIKLKFGR
jgi:hypothetical protein